MDKDKITDESSTETKQNNENKIPNSLEQLRQNLAYSLEITKNRLMLSNNYNIPEINNYKAFIKHVAYDFNSLEGDEKVSWAEVEDFFNYELRASGINDLIEFMP